MFQANQQIGNYFLIRELGRGGFGEVWLAERRTKLLTTKVAVKLPLDNQIDLNTVKQEACLWEQANGHPNVLPIIEADVYDGQAVIVSEYAPDGSLADLLRKQGKLPVEQAVEMTLGILAGLEFLHSRRIIHRDLKPANILLQGETPRLADFGIARALRTAMTSRSVNLAGTPAYMAPEAFDKKRNQQTDVWAVGVILYEILSGRLPFPEGNLIELVAAIANDEPESLPDEVPNRLKRIVKKALEKNPEHRYKTAAEMRGDVKQLAELPKTQTDHTSPPRPMARKWGIVVSTLSILLAGGLGATIYLTRFDGSGQAIVKDDSANQSVAGGSAPQTMSSPSRGVTSTSTSGPDPTSRPSLSSLANPDSAPVEAEHTELEIIDYDGNSISLSEPSIAYSSGFGPSKEKTGIAVRRGVEESFLLWSRIRMLKFRSRQEKDSMGKTVWRHDVVVTLSNGAVTNVEIKNDWNMAYMGGGGTGLLFGRTDLGEIHIPFSKIAVLKVLKYARPEKK